MMATSRKLPEIDDGFGLWPCLAGLCLAALLLGCGTQTTKEENPSVIVYAADYSEAADVLVVRPRPDELSDPSFVSAL